MMWTLSSKRSVGLGLKNVACAKRQQEATDFPTQGTPMPGWRVSNSLKTQFTQCLEQLSTLTLFRITRDAYNNLYLYK